MSRESSYSGTRKSHAAQDDADIIHEELRENVSRKHASSLELRLQDRTTLGRKRRAREEREREQEKETLSPDIVVSTNIIALIDIHIDITRDATAVTISQLAATSLTT